MIKSRQKKCIILFISLFVILLVINFIIASIHTKKIEYEIKNAQMNFISKFSIGMSYDEVIFKGFWCWKIKGVIKGLKLQTEGGALDVYGKLGDVLIESNIFDKRILFVLPDKMHFSYKYINKDSGTIDLLFGKVLSLYFDFYSFKNLMGGNLKENKKMTTEPFDLFVNVDGARLLEVNHMNLLCGVNGIDEELRVAFDKLSVNFKHQFCLRALSQMLDNLKMSSDYLEELIGMLEKQFGIQLNAQGNFENEHGQNNILNAGLFSDVDFISSVTLQPLSYEELTLKEKVYVKNRIFSEGLGVGEKKSGDNTSDSADSAALEIRKKQLSFRFNIGEKIKFSIQSNFEDLFEKNRLIAMNIEIGHYEALIDRIVTIYNEYKLLGQKHKKGPKMRENDSRYFEFNQGFEGICEKTMLKLKRYLKDKFYVNDQNCINRDESVLKLVLLSTPIEKDESTISGYDFVQVLHDLKAIINEKLGARECVPFLEEGARVDLGSKFIASDMQKLGN